MGNHSYTHSTTQMSWNDAAKKCSLAGGQLPVVLDAQTHAEVTWFTSTYNLSDHWLGARAELSDWLWVKGTYSLFKQPLNSNHSEIALRKSARLL